MSLRRIDEEPPGAAHSPTANASQMDEGDVEYAQQHADDNCDNASEAKIVDLLDGQKYRQSTQRNANREGDEQERREFEIALWASGEYDAPARTQPKRTYDAPARTQPKRGHRKTSSAPQFQSLGTGFMGGYPTTIPPLQNDEHLSSSGVPTTVAFSPSQQDEVSNFKDGEITFMPLDLSHPAKWAITFQQLLDVEAEAKNLFGFRYWKKNMRDITEAIVIPECRKSGTSYALSKNPKSGHTVQAFITHCWDEPFGSFVDSIRTAFHDFPIKPNLWICAFALVQGNQEVVADQLQMPLDESPFVLALQHATWFVVVRNSKKDLYSRIWCVCELIYATKFGFTKDRSVTEDDDVETTSRNTTMVIGPDVFSGSCTSCVEAEAWDPKDKTRILEVLQSENTIEEVDALVSEYRRHGKQRPKPRDQRQRPGLIGPALFVFLIAIGIVVWLVVSPPDSGAGTDPTIEPETNLPTGTATPATPPPVEPGDFLNQLPNNITTKEALEDPTTAQAKARNWSRFNPDYASKAQWQQEQLFALVTLFHSFDGDKWYEWEKHHWLSRSINECAWDAWDAGGAIDCNKDGRVTKLRLDSKGARGRTPPEVSWLSSLELLEISHMDLSTPLNQIMPPQLSSLHNLADLLLPDNSLSGSLPSYIGSFHQLTNLNLKSNGIDGPLPSEMGLMSRLQALLLVTNAITGGVPSELASLDSLKALYIHDNNLIGTIPTDLCLLPFLKVLQVDCFKVTCPLECSCRCGGLSAVSPEPTEPTVAPTALDWLTNEPFSTDAPTEGSFLDNLPEYAQTGLDDPNSPQSQAWDWLLNDPLYEDLEQWQLLQRFAVATFYISLVGTSWQETYEAQVCDWGTDGMSNECNDLDRITRLVLHEQTEVPMGDGYGTIPPELSLLTSLEWLDIEYVDLNATLITVLPTQLASLQSLSQLTLSRSRITGSMPSTLGTFDQLSGLDLGSNEIVGPIPTEVGLMTSLQVLSLRHNLLSGAIPTELGAMSSLVTLELQDNNLNGTLPVGICLNKENLEVLAVDCRKVVCPIECNCDCADPESSLVEGTTPAPTESPSEEPRVTPLPTQESNHILNLPGYALENLEDSTSPQSYLNTSPQWQAMQWLENHPNLPGMEEWRQRQLFALWTFFYSFNGTGWVVYDNRTWLSYEVPECKWEDTVCDDDDGTLLELSIKSTEGFNGSVLPPEIGLLSSLEAFKLTFLEDLTAALSNLIPTQLAHLQLLKTLFVHDTEVYGSIPSQLASLASLTSLNLKHNNLNGTLPTEIGLLSNLQFASLFENDISGMIPSEIGLMTSLESLLLDRTQVSGTVPTEVCSLPSLLLRVNCSLVVNCTACAACSCYTET